MTARSGTFRGASQGWSYGAERDDSPIRSSPGLDRGQACRNADKRATASVAGGGL